MPLTNDWMHPMFGINPRNFSVADCPGDSSLNPTTQAIASTSTNNTVSTLQTLGSNGIRVVCAFTNTNGSCSIDVMDGSNVVLKTFNGITPLHNTFYAGNFEGLDLSAGFKLSVYNIVNGPVTVNVGRIR